MVELATSTPLQDHCIAQAPFQVISSLLSTVNVRHHSIFHIIDPSIFDCYVTYCLHLQAIASVVSVTSN